MSATTGLDLLARADLLTRELRRTTVAVAARQWRTFDATVHRLLLEIAGLNGFHVRPGDPSRTALHLALRDYPQPLQAPLATTLSPAQAVPFMAVYPDTVRKLVRDGELPAAIEPGGFRIDSSQIRGESDIRPADPADPHPFARVCCALGALADLLHEARSNSEPVLEARGEIAGATIHVLSLTAVVARHTLAHGPLDDLVRPAQIAHHAEHAIDTLREVALRPASLGEVMAVSMLHDPVDATERLTAALHQWHRATKQELDRMIPAVEVMRQIANQGAHLYAVADLLEQTRGPAGAMPARPESLREASRALRRGEHAWEHLTTLSRPSHEFVTTSRELYESLHGLAATIQHTDQHVDRGRAERTLRRGLVTIGELMTATRGLPETFLNARILLAPATAIPQPRTASAHGSGESTSTSTTPTSPTSSTNGPRAARPSARSATG